jgi:hypothetical protein
VLLLVLSRRRPLKNGRRAEYLFRWIRTAAGGTKNSHPTSLLFLVGTSYIRIKGIHTHGNHLDLLGYPVPVARMNCLQQLLSFTLLIFFVVNCLDHRIKTQ